MAAVKTKLGRIPCEGCGTPVMLRENEAGTLSYACDECDKSTFAKKGTGCANNWRSMLPKALEKGEPEQGAKQEPKASAKQGFSFSSLRDK